MVVVDVQGCIVAEFRIEHSVAGWQQWKEKIAAFPSLGVAIETSFGAAVEQLLESGVTVYPVNPMNAKRYRERKCSSGNKTDHLDAWSLADALRLDGQAWRPLTVQDPVIAELRILAATRWSSSRSARRSSTSSSRPYTNIIPTALEAFDDWTSSGAWAFVEAFPTAEALIKAGKRKWDKFLHSHKLYRPQTYQNRIAIFEQAGQWKATWLPPSPPRVSWPWPAASNCASSNSNSKPTANASRRFSPATRTAPCSVRCREPGPSSLRAC